MDEQEIKHNHFKDYKQAYLQSDDYPEEASGREGSCVHCWSSSSRVRRFETT